MSCHWSCSPWSPQEQQGSGVAKGLKKRGEVPYLARQGSLHRFRAASSIPRPNWDRVWNCLFSLGWDGVSNNNARFPFLIACPCSLPDPACLSPAGDWTQRVCQSRALRAGVTERGTPFTAKAKKRKPHQGGEVHGKSFSEIPAVPGSGHQQKMKHQAYK